MDIIIEDLCKCSRQWKWNGANSETLPMCTALRTAEDSMVRLKTRTQQKFE